LYGIYNATNIQAAFAIGRKFDVPASMILMAIEEYIPEMNRSQIKKIGTTTFLMDAYNANPSSMKLSIQSFGKIKTNLKKVLILGDMKELGKDEIEFHEEVLDITSTLSWHQIYIVGEIFSKIENNSVTSFENVDSLIKHIKESKDILDHSIVLLKASRSIQLERLIDQCFIG